MHVIMPVRCAGSGHRIPAMRAHLTALDHDGMDTAPALYRIRISGHLGATMLFAFSAMTPQREGADTVLTGQLDRSALYGVLAQIDALGLDLLEVSQLTRDRLAGWSSSSASCRFASVSVPELALPAHPLPGEAGAAVRAPNRGATPRGGTGGGRPR